MIWNSASLSDKFQHFLLALYVDKEENFSFSSFKTSYAYLMKHKYGWHFPRNSSKCLMTEDTNQLQKYLA